MLVHNFPGVRVVQTSWGVLNDTYEEDVLLGAPGSGFALLHDEVEDDEFEMDASLVLSDATSDMDTETDTDTATVVLDLHVRWVVRTRHPEAGRLRYALR